LESDWIRMQIDIIRYGSQALVMTIGATGILFFGLMTPVVAFFNPILAIGSFIFAGAIAFGTVEIVDRIDTWADKQIYITA
jgi:hypothetical protein